MVYEKFFSSHDNFWGWRCVTCGEILDPIILENRRMYSKRGWLKGGGNDSRQGKRDEFLR
jgi:hypothetical protein